MNGDLANGRYVVESGLAAFEAVAGLNSCSLILRSNLKMLYHRA
jgi:hypothetical protein